MCMSCMSFMDLGWGLIANNRSQMNVKMCSVIFRLVYAINRPIYDTQLSCNSCTLCALESCHINLQRLNTGLSSWRY